MHTIPCPDCQSPVSDRAPACPRCGRPLRPAGQPLERTGRELKAHQMVAALVAVAGLAAGLYGLWRALPALHALGLALFGAGFVWLLAAHLAAWWRHG